MIIYFNIYMQQKMVIRPVVQNAGHIHCGNPTCDSYFFFRSQFEGNR